MPTSLRTLAELSFLAQQSLTPCVATPKQPSVTFEDGSITSHYNQYRDGQYVSRESNPKGLDGLASFMAQSAIPDAITNLDLVQSTSDGGWYPDTWHPRIAWRGGKEACDRAANEIDPFRMVRSEAVDAFTEKLIPGLNHNAHPLQWTMKQDGSRSSTRGNIPLANLNAKPEWLMKHDFRTLGKLRAFPLLQLRSLLVGLAEDAL